MKKFKDLINDTDLGKYTTIERKIHLESIKGCLSFRLSVWLVWTITVAGSIRFDLNMVRRIVFTKVEPHTKGKDHPILINVCISIRFGAIAQCRLTPSSSLLGPLSIINGYNFK